VPWVHNVRNTDAVAAIDDEDCMRLFRLFNEPAGQEYLAETGLDPNLIQSLPLLGISSIANLLAAIKSAKYWELGGDEVILTIFTDSAEMYRSRLTELAAACGAYRRDDALRDHAGPLAHQSVDYFRELTYTDRKAIHNLKYYTWVEQQGKSSEELNAQWDPEYWRALFEDEVDYFDELIVEFNGEIANS